MTGLTPHELALVGATFGRFWYEFLVGDDWRIVAGVTAILGVGALAVAMGLTGPAVMITVFIALVAVFAWPLLTDRQT